MHYRSFRIENFKGIKDTTISISSSEDARVHTLVGLNESGKTTILEAIHSFAPDNDTRVVVGSDLSTDKADSNIVPRYAVSDFTGEISVTAEIFITKEDKDEISFALKKNHDIDIQFKDPAAEVITYKRFHKYAGGDYKGKFRKSSVEYTVKKKSQRRFRDPSSAERSPVYNAIENIFPRIAYFPTFVFDFPDKIYLSGRGRDKKNAFYRRVFQDILDFDGRGHQIEEHIVRRVQREDFSGPWVTFFNMFRSSGETEKIDQVIDRAAQVVTRTIFAKWNEIFQEDAKGKEVIIPWQTDEGLPEKNSRGSEVPAEKHDVYIQFRIKDGVNRYNVEDRSLGFRWFFAFLLFTQFRVAREQGGATIFLFDEPASNLHSAAQQKLIESFVQIAQPPNSLIYSTHSHYMIEPKWLEQAYIIENGAERGDQSVLESGLLDDSSLNIRATPYRRFVNIHPTKTSFYRPILDRLEVVPSRFDIKSGGLIVEGKSDYYIMRHFIESVREGSINIFPALGAGTLGSLIALHRGWGLAVRVLLDGDAAGRREKVRYKKEFMLSDKEIMTLNEIDGSWCDVESLISADDVRRIVGNDLSDKKLIKSSLLLHFQERLVSGRKEKFSRETMENVDKLHKAINDFLKA